MARVVYPRILISVLRGQKPTATLFEEMRLAILLDSFQNGARGPWRYWYRRCGHLVSDTSLEELHGFAASLGLRREWFQLGSIPHYDLTGEVYELAIAHGAELVSSRELVRRALRMRPWKTADRG